MSTLNNETEPKKVLVTGASSGIGKEVAKRLVGLKHSVFVTGRDSERLTDRRGQRLIIRDLTLPAFVSN